MCCCTWWQDLVLRANAIEEDKFRQRIRSEAIEDSNSSRDPKQKIAVKSQIQQILQGKTTQVPIEV